MMQRYLFQISTDTGTQGDTGQAVVGEIAQVRWNPTTADTGGDLQLALLPRLRDTGDGYVFFNDNDCLGANFQRVPVQSHHHIDGADTGTENESLIAAAGDRIRVKVTPGGAAVVGRLYIWVKG